MYTKPHAMRMVPEDMLTKFVTARLREKDHEALQAFAARERRDVSNMIRVIIQDRLAEEGYGERKTTRARR